MFYYSMRPDGLNLVLTKKIPRVCKVCAKLIYDLTIPLAVNLIENPFFYEKNLPFWTVLAGS